jgi:hypothetical protein
MTLFRETMDGAWNPSLLKDQSDATCEAAYAVHCAFLKRIGQHPAEAGRSELGGHNLACYCAPSLACHADILLDIVMRH